MAAVERDAPDRLATLLTRLDGLRQEERRVASARMVSVIGHMIGTPLNVMAGRAALIRSNPGAEGVGENARRIEEQVERLSQRVRRLVDYFGAPAPDPEHQTIAEIIEKSLEIYGPVAGSRGVSIQVRKHELGTARINCALGLLSLTTLLSLGARTTPAGQSLILHVTARRPSHLVLAMSLPGLAVPPTRLERLEPPEEGVRYDVDALEVLSICLGLAYRSGGTLDVAPAPSGPGAIVSFACAYT